LAPTAQAAPGYRDRLLALAGGLLLGLLIAQGELLPALSNPLFAVLRTLLGLAYVLYAPGYLLQALFFPRRDDLDGIERAGLSLGLSVALVPLLALLLDALPWGLRLWPIVLGQGGLVLFLALAVALVRRFQPPGEAYAPDLRPDLRGWWRTLEKGERRLMLAMLAALLFAGSAAAYIFLVPSEAEFMTEFYVLGKEGLAEDYPRQAAVGEPLTVTMGVTNRERTAMSYRVEIWVQNGWDETRRQQVGALGPFELPAGETVEAPLAWAMPWAGEDQRVDVLLFAGEGAEPYRRLRLWVNVK
jgi:uncharacterized membrane protein